MHRRKMQPSPSIVRPSPSANERFIISWRGIGRIAPLPEQGSILRELQWICSDKWWGWVPLVDFAVGLRDISAAIEAGIAAAKKFEFTESDVTLEFERHGADVNIRSSYAPGKIVLPSAEFRKRVLDFGRRLDMELLSRLPGLRQNAAYQSLKLSGLRE
jgi:hypothetical protein